MLEVQQEALLHKATFNPLVKRYIFLVVCFYLVVSVIGLILLPIWLFGFGQWLSRKFYKTLRCELIDRNLHFSKGLIIHVEKTIPLENIQDLAFIGGPILRWLGLTLIRVETAGGGGPHQHHEMSIIGIDQAEQFKSAILKQREIVLQKKSLSTSPMNSQQPDTDILTEIRDVLIDIRNRLSSQP